jgi:hypothetical protein
VSELYIRVYGPGPVYSYLSSSPREDIEGRYGGIEAQLGQGGKEEWIDKRWKGGGVCRTHAAVILKWYLIL